LSTDHVVASPIPSNYRSALADPNWRAAMADEFQALIDNVTWRLIPRPPGANVMTGKWIFKHKYHSDGSLAHHKARWVVRGFSQQHGIDYDETFSPVVKPGTIRTTYIKQIGFVASVSDTSLFVYKDGAHIAYLLLYVDDIVLTASSTRLLHDIIGRLHTEFAMTDLGALHHFL